MDLKNHDYSDLSQRELDESLLKELNHQNQYLKRLYSKVSSIEIILVIFFLAGVITVLFKYLEAIGF